MRGTTNYFGNQNLSISEEKKVKRDLCSQLKIDSDVSSEYYVINYFTPCRSLINTKIIAKSL